MNKAAYDLMVSRILEDSFLPRANMRIMEQVNKDLDQAELENKEAEMECGEHFSYLDSAEYCIKNQIPF